MEDKILFLSAPLVERIWGGTYFKDTLKVTDSDKTFGEMWTASGYKDTQSIILNGTYKGLPLGDVFKNHKELFNNSKLDEFPILIKVIASSDDLSVQVHPDDDYAKTYENGVGKTEGWLILDCAKDSYLIFGHNAKNKQELINYVENDDYDHLLNKNYVSVGQFYPIPSGTIHAIGKNIVLLEVQQSSDITYRFFDYHRKDKFGNERQLHVKKAIDVTTFNNDIQPIVNVFEQNQQCIWDNKYFVINMYDINESLNISKDENYLIGSVISGNVRVDNQDMTLGNSFILTSLCKDITFTGKGKIVLVKSKI